jgi:hypothetical protein
MEKDWKKLILCLKGRSVTYQHHPHPKPVQIRPLLGKFLEIKNYLLVLHLSKLVVLSASDLWRLLTMLELF